MESETAKSEFMLSNATQRLLGLERDVGAVRQKTWETSNSAELAQNQAEHASEETEQAKRVTWSPLKEKWMEGQFEVERKEEEKQSYELHNS